MKYLLAFMLFPTILSAQLPLIDETGQIDAKSIKISTYEDSGDGLFIFAEHDTIAYIDEEPLPYSGGTDIAVITGSAQRLGYELSLASPGDESWQVFDSKGEDLPQYLIANFTDSLFLDLDDDTMDDHFSSDLSNATGILKFSEGGVSWRSYISGADKYAMKSRRMDETLFLTGVGESSMLYEDPNGQQTTVVGDSLFFFVLKIAEDGSLANMITIPTDGLPNVADMILVGENPYLLLNETTRTHLVMLDVQGNITSTNTWENTRLVDADYHDESLYFSGSVDSESEHDLAFEGDLELFIDSGNGDVGLLLSYAENLDFQWLVPIAGVGQSHIASFDINNSGDIITTGYVRGESYFATFPLGPIDTLVGAEDNDDLFLAKLNTEGQVQWAHVYPGEGNDSGKFVLIDTNEEEFSFHMVCGFTGDLEIYDNEFSLDFVDTYEASEESFVYTYFRGEGSVSTIEADLSQINISPNPTTSILTIDIEDPVGAVRIIDLTGRVLLSQAGATDIIVSSLNPGTYLIEVSLTSGQKWIEKFVKL